jgi:predicted nucleic acid-binding protein
MIVIDANILFRAVLGRRARQLIETYASQGVRFLAFVGAVGNTPRHYR